MSTENNNGTTSVQQVEMDAVDLLNMPGAANVITQTPEGKKPGLFSSKVDDLSFIDNPDPDEDDDEEKLDADGKVIPKTPKPDATAAAAAAILNIDEEDDDSKLSPEELAKKQAGRPKGSKEMMISVVGKLIEEGKLFGFNDDKKLEDYTAKDIEDLLQANFDEKEKELREKTPLEFFDSLPQELQYAAKYIADGGKNLKQLFRTLAATEEAKSLDPKTPEGQVQIVRTFLAQTTKFTPEEIEEEITGWKDRDELEAKATKFKPKLDALNEENIAVTLQTQEANRKKQIEQSKKYTENIYNALAPGELNGIKLDKKIQSMLYAGLVQPNYPSISGQQTNLLGHLLEKYQFVEPNHGLIAEALYLLQDPEGYRDKVREVAKKDATAATVKKLKTAEANKNGSGTGTGGDDDSAGANKKPTLKRPGTNMFAR